ncbi:hypothetical protein [Phenylobacterium sp.]|jgi:hypothetical protein|uniref:hypothetical protein n=1 Tax=Phenylobacterium sp. TaxID=1871053 RepID=UPI002F94DAD9
MRSLAAAAVFAAALAGTGCVTAPADGSPRVQTTGDANRENLKGAVRAPLRDLNLLRTKIPVVLLEAMADPYARPPRRVTCVELVALVQPLNDALGADLDTPSTDEDDLLLKGRESAYGAVAGVTTDAIPFRGWVRKLSGAERHDRLVQAAISAGAVRRAYLKGLGEARGCPPPATPSHELAGSEVITQEFRPRYPTRPPPPGPGKPAETPKASPRR